MFVDTFIRRPILASVCSLVIILAGAVAIPSMPIAQYPDLAPPQVNVTAFYNGANAQAVESAVTTPLEQALNGVEGMLYLTSSSTNSGVSQITVTFDVTRNSDIAAVDVQNRVSQTLGRLPPEVRALGVNVQKNSTGFVLGAGVYAENGAYDSLFLSNYIDVYVKDALQRVPGVGQVLLFGERRYSMRLWLDPNKLANRGLTARDVVTALQEQNVQVAAGSVGDAPSVPGQTYQISVRAEGRLIDAREFDDIILKSGDAGSLVRLSDVGHAELGAESYSSQLRFQGIDAVGFGVIQLPSANALDVDRLVRAELERLSKSFPPGLKYQVAFNTTQVVDESIKEVRKTLIEAIALVVLVMFIFLQSWRSTLIPTITIPVSLVGAFAFAKVMGFSINTLTLFGIILATGIVVDDAIVVIENIERHIQEDGKPARQAASDAMREVFGAVIATALVLIAVFVPVAFFPGTTGRLYSQFSITIAFSVALSAFNALTLTPALSGLLLDRADHGKGLFFRGVERIISAGTQAYVAVLGRAMRWRWAVVLVFILALGATAWLYRTVPRAFVPEEDAGYFIAVVQAPAGASLDYTSAIARQAEQLMLKDPDIEGVFSVMGFSFSGAAPNQAPDLLQPEAVRGTARHRSRTEDGARAIGRAAVRNPGGDCGGVPAAVHSGPRTVRRLRVPGPRPDGHGHQRALGGHLRHGRRGQCVAAAGRAVQLVYDERSADDRGDRSRAGVGARRAAQRDHQRAPDLHRLAVRERLRFQQPGVSGLRAGRSRVPRRPIGAGQVVRPQSRRQDAAARERGPHEGDHRAAGHQPLQPVPIGDHQRLGEAGIQLGPGARGDGARRTADAAGGNELRLVGIVVRGGEVGPADVRHLRTRPAPRLPDARGAVREPRPAVHRPSRGAAGRVRRTCGSVAARLRQRCLRPDRAAGSGRPGGKERDPDRRVRGAAARSQGRVSSRRRSRPRGSGCDRF